jgi:CubicO group peptidase (beta-lactamase class C family)
MQKKRFLLITIFVFLVSINPGAKETTVTLSEKLVPTNVRLINSNSLGSEYAGLEKTVESFLRKWSINGISVAIAKDGKLVYARGFGFADTAMKYETQPFNKFRIASVSKLVTAVGIMKLREDGKISLEDKVFGPEGILDDPFFSDPKDKRVNDITVAHLLRHEGGWTQTYGDQMFMPHVIAGKMGISAPVDARTITRFALDRRLHFTPGTGRSYSNLGYSILGLVIEKTSGMPYEEYCKRTLLEPLGIYDMAIAGNLEEEKAPLEVTYYEPRNAVLKPSLYEPGKMCHSSYGGNDITTLGSAGGWIATAPDLIRLLLGIDGSGSRPDILSEESIRLMTQNEKGAAPLGWKTTISNGTWWRTGYFPGTSAMMKKQSDGFSWVVLCNSSSWNGPEIYTYINNMMSRIFNEVETWPDYDLFNYSLPVPLKTSLQGFPG